MLLLLTAGGYGATWGVTQFSQVLRVEDYKTNGAIVEDIHQWLRSRAMPISFIVPDNDHTAGLVEEALLKGLSNAPTWDITSGQSLLERLEPGLSFHASLSELPDPDSIILWIDIPGQPSLRASMPLLDAAVRQPGMACQTWHVNQREVFACDSTPEASSWLESADESAVVAESGDMQEVGPIYIDEWGNRQRIAAGQLMWQPRNETLVRMNMDGRFVLLSGSVGQHVRVTNIGPWDPQTRHTGGAYVFWDQQRWTLDQSQIAGTNVIKELLVEPDLSAAQPRSWFSPADAGYEILRLEDERGPFLRVLATGPAPYLVVNAQDLVAQISDGPVSISAEVRGSGSGLLVLTLYEVASDSGDVRTHVDSAPVGSEWATLYLAARTVVHPSSADNFSVGIVPAERGQWFDIRQLSVFYGRSPRQVPAYRAP